MVAQRRVTSKESALSSTMKQLRHLAALSFLVILLTLGTLFRSTSILNKHHDGDFSSSHDPPSTSSATVATSQLPPGGDAWTPLSRSYVPNNWTLEEPCDRPPGTLSKLPRHIHYHIQHHMGTALFELAKHNHECGPRACLQMKKQCLVSYDEMVEAQNIQTSNLTFIPYELMLPPKFPLPFVRAREGFYFTTFMRDPMERHVSMLRYRRSKMQELFWADLGNDNGYKIYHADNLSVRWLAGVHTLRAITDEDVRLAKCRLELFDLVLTDKTLHAGMTKVLCPARLWTQETCEAKFRPKITKKQDPLVDGGGDDDDEMDPVLVGAWIERHRPSFEVYDYARHLSAQHLKRAGVNHGTQPDQPERPSYVDALERYVNAGKTNPQKDKTIYSPKAPKFELAKPECDDFHAMWTSNDDTVPNVFGIGTLEFERSA